MDLSTEKELYFSLGKFEKVQIGFLTFRGIQTEISSADNLTILFWSFQGFLNSKITYCR